ncbi:MAG: TetR/AcrR family transcriptional regulator [Bacillota bacterium]|nr:TetR/AcrR family transcriptional regulator [Bacillota bacterium]
MRKQPEITAATRNAFVDAFCALYEDRKSEKITVQEIADKAGYNRSTFYQYFRDIYGILDFIEEDTLSYVKKNITTVIRHIDFEEEFILAFTQRYQEKDKYVKLLLSSRNISKFSVRLKAEMFPVLTEIFQLPEDDPKVTYILDFYLSSVFAVISRWFNNGRDIPAPELAGLLRDMLMKGVFPQLYKYARNAQEGPPPHTLQ